MLGIVGRGGPGATIGVAAERGAVGVIGERPAGRLFRLAKHLGQKLDRRERAAAEVPKSRAPLPGGCRNGVTGAQIGAALVVWPDGELPDLTVVPAPATGTAVELDARLPLRRVLASGRNCLYRRHMTEAFLSMEPGRQPVQAGTGRRNDDCRGDATHLAAYATFSIVAI